MRSKQTDVDMDVKHHMPIFFNVWFGDTYWSKRIYTRTLLTYTTAVMYTFIILKSNI